MMNMTWHGPTPTPAESTFLSISRSCQSAPSRGDTGRGAYLQPDDAHSMRLRRRQGRKRHRRRATSAHRAPSPVATPQAQHYRDVQNVSAITKAGRYERMRMMKYNSETSYDRVACPPLYLIFLNLPIEEPSCQENSVKTRKILPRLCSHGRGYSAISSPVVAAVCLGTLTLIRAATWIPN
jgi:hypothetical protein